jgi:hypothetical protein
MCQPWLFVYQSLIHQSVARLGQPRGFAVPDLSGAAYCKPVCGSPSRPPVIGITNTPLPDVPRKGHSGGASYRVSFR